MKSKAWTLDRKRVARQVEVANIPDFVRDSLELGTVAVCDGILYANTLEGLLGNEFSKDEITIMTE